MGALVDMLEPNAWSFVDRTLPPRELQKQLRDLCRTSSEPGVWLLLAELTEQPSMFLRVVDEYKQRGFHRNACVVLEHLVQTHPDVVGYRETLRDLYLELNRYSDANQQQKIIRSLDRGTEFLDDVHVVEELGGYHLTEKLGEGGWGAVYRAKTFGVEGFERVVAVKRMRRELATNQDYIAMMAEEAKLVVQFEHANIARVHDLGQENGEYFIVLDHVDGHDLRTIFTYLQARGAPLDLACACHIVMMVCEGLDYAHNRRAPSGRELFLVHRDVTPSNVLVSYEGEVKLTDFGLAYTQVRGGQLSGLVGKLGYMSPEQVTGFPVDRRTDVFSLGVVLYELITGRRLFVGDNEEEVIEQIAKLALLPPSAYNRKIPDVLEQIVLKALARDAENRYQSAIDFHDELQAFVYTAGEFYSRKDLAGFMRQHRETMDAHARRQRVSHELEASRFQSTSAHAAIMQQVKQAAASIGPSRVAEGSVSRAVRGRVGDGKSVSNARAFELHQLAARNAEDALRAKRSDVAESRRLEAARQHVQAVETTLMNRLLRTFSAETRAVWRQRRVAADIDVMSSRESHVERFLSTGKPPSLAILATWLKPKSAPRPTELAQALFACLGISASQRPMLHVLGSVRIVLAHQVEYEHLIDDDIQQASEFVTCEVVGKLRRFDIAPEDLDRLEQACGEILRTVGARS